MKKTAIKTKDLLSRLKDVYDTVGGSILASREYGIPLQDQLLAGTTRASKNQVRKALSGIDTSTPKGAGVKEHRVMDLVLPRIDSSGFYEMDNGKVGKRYAEASKLLGPPAKLDLSSESDMKAAEKFAQAVKPGAAARDFMTEEELKAAPYPIAPESYRHPEFDQNGNWLDAKEADKQARSRARDVANAVDTSWRLASSQPAESVVLYPNMIGEYFAGPWARAAAYARRTKALPNQAVPSNPGIAMPMRIAGTTARAYAPSNVHRFRPTKERGLVELLLGSVKPGLAVQRSDIGTAELVEELLGHPGDMVLMPNGNELTKPQWVLAPYRGWGRTTYLRDKLKNTYNKRDSTSYAATAVPELTAPLRPLSWFSNGYLRRPLSYSDVVNDSVRNRAAAFWKKYQRTNRDADALQQFFTYRSPAEIMRWLSANRQRLSPEDRQELERIISTGLEAVKSGFAGSN